jgi:signal transduction histidine kinase
LLAVATGRPPALLAERGLSGAVGALAATAGLPVMVSIDPCDDLDAEVQRNLWFLVGDAVTNVLKHADATSLTINLERRRGDVRVTVGDDGRGGVSVAPSSLQRRVESCGGSVHVTDGPGRGTTVAIVVPERALVPA